MAAYGFIIGVVKVVGADASLFSPAAHTIVHHLAEVVVSGLVLSWVFLFKRSIDFSGLWRAVLLFTATGLVFLPLLGDLLGGIALVLIANLLIYLAIIAAVFLLSDRNFSRQRIFADLGAPLPEESAYTSIEQSCQALGTTHGLTGREVEIVQLICKGRSKGYIAETLFISENTVRSHSKRIYNKLNVHSKQELLNLIDFGEEG